MLVLKNRVTNSVLKSEKASLLRFFILYITMISILIVLSLIFYYQTEEKLFLAHERVKFTKYAYIQKKRLKVLHHYFDEKKTYPRDERFKSAIYDIDGKKIFSLLENKEINLDEIIYISNGYIHYIDNFDVYYLGAKYLILEVKDNEQWHYNIWKSIIIYGFLALISFMLFGLFLARLFLKPMRDSIVLLDRFIKDTTHELNTPLTAILSNIEMIDEESMSEKNRKKLTRINIAAKTVSRLYKDLTFLTLEQDRKNNNTVVDIKKEIIDRIEYFYILAKSKNIKFEKKLDNSTIYIDRIKFIQVLDNLISNAIKYNVRGGKIIIKLEKNILSIEDTGIGIDEAETSLMFDRYKRFNNSEGGFGIGLNIVKQILDEYNINIEVNSKVSKGTKIILSWNKYKKVKNA
ncbi:Two-component system histidine kinase DccS [hydrothermal vent metagenome]|uniref:Two-component system histidine kinase DccS n=1 Tax=hydrothermal vent metagenome TaxID=652676 RepID=A0A1W1EDH2_9ZZZZ